MTEEDKDDKKATKKRKNQFVDDQVQETPSRSKKKRKTGQKERKCMSAAKKEIKSLLELLHNSDNSDDHYDWPTNDCHDKVAQALRYAYVPEWEDRQDPEYQGIGGDVFWDWWSKPMQHMHNKTWKRKHQIDAKDTWQSTRHEKEIKKAIEDKKTKWFELYATVHPCKEQVEWLRGWVTHVLKNRKMIVNPGSKDEQLSELALRYLTQSFVVIDKHGSSIVWEEKERLWVCREKERSPAALGKALKSLIGDKIVFTDEKVETEFMNKIRTAGAMVGPLTWLRSEIPFQGKHPMQEKLNKDMWSLPLLDGQICDLKTLTIRDRTPADIFSQTTNFRWFVDKVEDGTMIMEEARLDTFKAAVKARESKIEDIMEELCPNAIKFVRGPFRDPGRFNFFILNLGLMLTTYCTRKCLWIFGDGKGMKSTLMLAVVAALGEFAVVANKKVFFRGDESSSGHNTDLMRCQGKRLIVVDELDKRDQLKETLYKIFAAHGLISAREIYGCQGEWKACGYPVFISNVVVSLNFDNASIPDRTLAIRGMTRVFNPSDEQQRAPPHYSKAEEWKDGTGVAPEDPKATYWVMKDPKAEAWAARFLVPGSEGGLQDELGCFLLLCAHYAYHQIQIVENGGELKAPPIIAEDYRAFVKEADHVGQYIADNLTIDSKGRTKLKEVYTDYKLWCSEQGVKPIQLKHLKSNLVQKQYLVMERTEYFDKKRNIMHKKGAPIAFFTGMITSKVDTFELDEEQLKYFT